MKLPVTAPQDQNEARYYLNVGAKTGLAGADSSGLVTCWVAPSSLPFN